MEHSIQVLLIAIFVAMLGLGIVSPIMPLYAESLGATYIQIGLLSSAWSISRFVFSAPAGRLSDSMSKKKIIMGGLLMYAFVSILYIFSWDYNSLLSFRFIHGIGSAMATPVAMAYAAEIAPKGKEGKYMGTMNLSMFGGMGIGPLIGGSLSDLFDLSAPFYFMGALTAISLVLTMKFLPETGKDGIQISKGPKGSFREILSKKILLASFLYRAVNSLGNSSIMGFLAIFMTNSVQSNGLGLSVTEAGAVLSVGQIASAILQKPSGDFADVYNKKTLIILGGLISAVGMASFAFTHTFLQVMGARLIFSLGSALITPAITAITAIEGRQLGIGTTMSLLQGSMSLGMMAGPLISGVMADLFNLTIIFFLGSAVSVIGLGIFWILQIGERE
jgi:DHA1 family multidrug resistance protein-like MFS transporter